MQVEMLLYGHRLSSVTCLFSITTALFTIVMLLQLLFRIVMFLHICSWAKLISLWCCATETKIQRTVKNTSAKWQVNIG